MPRSSAARLKSDVGETRESKIIALCNTGLGRDAIIAAIETDYTETMAKDDPRRKTKTCKSFDAIARQRMLEAIRSTARLEGIKEDEMAALTDAAGGNAQMQSIESTVLENMRRRSCGEPAIDNMYGKTRYIWVRDDNPKHPEKGRYIRGDYIPEWVPVSFAHKGYLEPGEKIPHADGRSLQGTFEHCFIESGIPDSFLSVWAGSPGVGKSRLAIDMTKKMNRMERERERIMGTSPRKVLYYNGEANPSQFRQWCGPNVDPELFLVHHGDMIRTEKVVADCLLHKPWAVWVDSMQMLAEVEKGLQGTIRALSRFKLLKNDPAAGLPHIFFISQLNKKGEMAGSRKIPHLVDMIANVTKYERGKGCFIIECPDKNRGGETGLGGMFRHTDTGIELISENHKKGPQYKLSQPGASGAPAAVTPVAPVRPAPTDIGMIV